MWCAHYVAAAMYRPTRHDAITAYQCNPAGDCVDPFPPINGDVSDYATTREGDSITFWCNDGFRPSGIMYSTCIETLWVPPPHELDCMFITGISLIKEPLYDQSSISQYHNHVTMCL